MLIDTTNSGELLQYALEHGIIDLSSVQAQIEVNKRKEILQSHPYKIWEGKDGKWRTYLPSTENEKRRMIKRSTREDVEYVIFQYYNGLIENKKIVPFSKVYFDWRSVHDKLVSSNTIFKYETDYHRFFEGQKFIEYPIDKITEETIQLFMVERIQTLNLTKRPTKRLFWYIKSVLKSALINKVIKENPLQYIEAKTFYKYCTEKTVDLEKKLVTDEEMDQLYRKFEEDYRDHPEYIPTYAVHLATLTGMRVGEIAALEWEDITDEYISISKSEKYDRINKVYFIDETKNKKKRLFPMTEEIKKLLDKLKRVEIQYGYVCNWVFANENGRVHSTVISSCSKNKCRQIGITEKGIHADRRTINSKMKCMGVPTVVAASLLGHTEEVNEQYYTFDITNMEEKAKIVSGINRRVV